MLRWMCAIMLALGLATPALAAGDKHDHDKHGHGKPRHADAHEHGHGKLNIAIEGNKLEAELEAPGADIVGFEHQAKTKADEAKVKAATKRLSDAGSVLALPVAAGCKQTFSDVDVHRSEGGDHNEFRVTYAFQCTNMSALEEINFTYFKNFKGGEELDVAVVSAKGQKAFEIGAGSPKINIGSLN